MRRLGERTITIDCGVLQGDGGTAPPPSPAAFGFGLACRGLLEQGLVKAMPIRHYVAGISAGIVDNVPMLDLQYSEDSRAMVDLNCVMNEQGGIIELQGHRRGRAFTAREQQELVALCAQGNARLIQLEKNILGEIL